MKLWKPLAAAAAAITLAGTAVAQTQEINFGFISTESSSGLKAAWQPVLEDMSKATGVKVNAFFATDYAGVIEAMRFNKVQVAWFGNKSAIEAVDRSNGEVFAKVVDTDGTEGYYSILVVHRDSPLKSLDDVLRQRAGLTLGFGDPNSTSGTVIPGYYAFAKHQVEPTKDFKRMVRANHETNLLAVVSKQVDVATNNTENWSRFEKTHPEKLKEVREIWRSPLIPSDPIVWRKDLDEATKAKVRDFMLNYGKKPEELAKLNKLGYSQFRPSSDAQLSTIRQIELVKSRAKVEGDASMSADEKARKLQDIDKKLDELGKQIASAK
ncbi:MAG: phosphonate ABC transporter substrate-binding protein [Piscinibacter sp.]|uniref:phosphonate ABC transporter substrate-binding protein n=1 Tax=Piscinibacter sp. TaxID=1903157 RepID=UPI003D0B23F9